MVVHAQEKGTAIAGIARATDNAAMVRRFIEECFNKGDMAVADELLAGAATQQGPSIADEPLGREDVKQEIVRLRMAFPDLHVTPCTVAAEGDRVVAYLWLGGTNTGSYRGMRATGIYAAWKAINTFRIADGHIVEQWGMADCASTLKRLGLIPEETQPNNRPSSCRSRGPRAGPTTRPACSSMRSSA